MSYWRDDRGSIYLVEGSVLFPISFMALFLLLFFMLVLFRQVNQEGNLRKALAQPTTSCAFAHPEESKAAKTLLSSSKWFQTGFLFSEQKVQQKEEVNFSAFRFFSIPAWEAKQERTSVWTSSANNLWRYEAINGFCAKQEQRKGGT